MLGREGALDAEFLNVTVTWRNLAKKMLTLQKKCNFYMQTGKLMISNLIKKLFWAGFAPIFNNIF